MSPRMWILREEDKDILVVEWNAGTTNLAKISKAELHFEYSGERACGS